MSLAVPTSSEFPTLAREGLVYLDTAATSQTVRPALEAMDRYYETYRASIHRGIYAIASEATDAYELARERVGAVHELDGRRDGVHEERDRGDQPRRVLVGPRERRPGRPRGDLPDGAPREHRPVAAARLPARVHPDARRRGAGSRRVRRAARAGPEARRGRARLQRRRDDQPGRGDRLAARTRRARWCWSTVRRPCRRCRSTSPSWTPTSTPGPATRPTGRPASACCTAGARSWRRCRRSSAAGT